MKKLLTTLLICLMSVISIFAFTACDDEAQKGNKGGNGNNTQQGGNKDSNESNTNQDGEVRYTVTEEEWEEAISLFNICDENGYADLNKIESKKDKLNFRLVENCSVEGSTERFILEVDYKNNIFKATLGEDVVDYAWENNGQYFEYSSSGIERISEEKFFEHVGMEYYSITAYLWIYLDVYRDMFGSYTDFNFDDETNTYNGCFLNQNFKLKFKNGQLIEMFLGFEDDGVLINYTIEYGVTVTIPDEILNLAK